MPTLIYRPPPIFNQVVHMVDKDIADVLSDKGRDVKKMFKDMDATLEQWKFSMEESPEGMRIELHATALIKKKNKQ
jgi:hypothetical protein